MIFGIEKAISKTFDWLEWGIQKIISFATSLIGFGSGVVKAKMAAKAA